jgi:EPS-associated MarR family transcriptional regulator
MPLQPADDIGNEEILKILREIKKSPEMTQRKLSSRLGISVGKINFPINAMIRRGLISVEYLKTSSNKKAYLYHLTPRRIEEKARTTYPFLKRKIREYERLEAEIGLLREEARENGIPVDG